MKIVALLGVEAGGEPVGHHLVDRALDHLALFVVGRQRVPVGGEVEALVLVLQADPVLERAVLVAEVHRAGRAHAREDAPARACASDAAGCGRGVARCGGRFAHLHWVGKSGRL